jgi:hypothetical protein
MIGPAGLSGWVIGEVFLVRGKKSRKALRGSVGRWFHATRPTFQKSEGGARPSRFFLLRRGFDVAVAMDLREAKS